MQHIVRRTDTAQFQLANGQILTAELSTDELGIVIRGGDQLVVKQNPRVMHVTTEAAAFAAVSPRR